MQAPTTRLSTPPATTQGRGRGVLVGAGAGKAVAVATETEARASKAPTQPAKPRADKADTEPTGESDDAVATAVPLSNETFLSTSDALVGYRSQLADLGIGLAEIDHVTATIDRYAAESEQMVVVYRLDPAQLDEILPLEITPDPDKLLRIRMVVLINADPHMSEKIDQLIEQMGHVEWSKRDAAQKQLDQLGESVRPNLEAALKNDDLEIVYRAEQLLEKFNTR